MSDVAIYAAMAKVKRLELGSSGNNRPISEEGSKPTALRNKISSIVTTFQTYAHQFAAALKFYASQATTTLQTKIFPASTAATTPKTQSAAQEVLSPELSQLQSDLKTLQTDLANLNLDYQNVARMMRNGVQFDNFVSPLSSINEDIVEKNRQITDVKNRIAEVKYGSLTPAQLNNKIKEAEGRIKSAEKDNAKHHQTEIVNGIGRTPFYGSLSGSDAAIHSQVASDERGEKSAQASHAIARNQSLIAALTDVIAGLKHVLNRRTMR